jgi:16S rRNA processing protein RimM
MEKDQCFEFGRLGKPVGHSGGIRLHHETDDARQYSKIKWMLLDISGSLIPHAIKSFRMRSDDTVYLEIEGIDTEEKARQVQGIQVFLPLELLPALSGNKFYFHEVIGWIADDVQYGEIGRITDILESGNQHLFSITKEGKEILIPVHDDFIDRVDRIEKRITFNTPEGLISLYLSNKEDEEEDGEDFLREILSS